MNDRPGTDTHAEDASATFVKQLERLRRSNEDAANRRVLLREFGGAVAAEDEEQLVRIRVDAHGAPEEIVVDDDWQTTYSSTELLEALRELLERIRQTRQEQADAYLNGHPDVLATFTDEQRYGADRLADIDVNAEVVDDPEGELIELSHRVSDLAAQARKQLAQMRQQPLAGLEQLPGREHPVRVLLMDGALFGLRINPDFLDAASTVQLNAAFASGIREALNPARATSETESLRTSLAQLRTRLAAVRAALPSSPIRIERER